VGGVLGLALIAGIVWFIMYRIAKKRREGEMDDVPEMTGSPYIPK